MDEVLALVGVPLRRDRMQFVEAATVDNIRHFAAGIGDDNPLWLDPSYVNPWATMLAPPTFLYAVDATIVAPKLAGLQWIYAGTDWRWFDIIRAGDRIEATATLKSVESKSGRRFGAWVLQTGQIVYRREGVVVAIAEGRTARTPRGQAGAEARPVPPTAASVDAGQFVVEPGDGQLPERRGMQPRTWDSVHVDDRLPALVKGPLSLADIFGWYAGAQGALHYGGAHGDAVRYRTRHADFEINRETGAKDATARGHFQTREGRSVGMDGAYDVGPQRISWAAQLVTDWAGDHGFLATLSIAVLKPNLVGDTVWWSGRVSDTFRRDAVGFATIELTATNQHGKTSARGTAEVALPLSVGAIVELPLRGAPP